MNFPVYVISLARATDRRKSKIDKNADFPHNSLIEQLKRRHSIK